MATTTASAISLPKPFAEGNPVEKYDICCTANGWENEAKAKRLPTLLEGEALAVWLELSEAEQKSYKDNRANGANAIYINGQFSLPPPAPRRIPLRVCA